MRLKTQTCPEANAKKLEGKRYESNNLKVVVVDLVVLLVVDVVDFVVAVVVAAAP